MSPKLSKFSTFDYSGIQGIPEIRLRVELLLKRLNILSKKNRPSILEIGVGSGDVTLMLAQHSNEVACVDSDEINCRLVSKRLREHNLNHVKIIFSKIEDVQLAENSYDHVVLNGVLEHLEDPVKVLRNLRACLCSGGRIHISVPLANSLHRLLGVEMGMIPNTEALAESDILFGHYRVYTPSMIRKHIKLAGLRISYEQPFYLKPLPTSMLTPLSGEIHRDLYLLGQKYPEFASYLYLEAAG